MRTRTINDHLCELIEMNQPVKLEQFVPEAEQKIIWQAIIQVGDHSLKTIREAIGQEYSYEQIKLVRAWWRRENNQSVST